MRLRLFWWLAVFACLMAAVISPVRAEADEKAPAENEAATEQPKAAIPLDGLSEKEAEELVEKAESFTFQAEVNRMMKLIINSLYKNKDIFLRELISNASDALDKIRFLSLTNKDALKANSELAIKIRADRDKGVLHVIDTGVGMSKEHLINNLGTIARSGTQEFMDALAKGDSNTLIGQFGVGFYSTFLVADTVVVTSKNNEDEDQWIWESDANSFKVTKDPRGGDYKLGRGTMISLHLKEEAKDMLKEDVLRELVAKYSQFINFPIYLHTGKEVEVTDVHEEEESEDSEEGEKEGEDVEVESEKEVKKTETKRKVTEYGYEQLNTVKPLWTRSPKDVTDEEYIAFYKDGFKQHSEPLAYTHFDAEGEISFKSLIYVPAEAPPQMRADMSSMKPHLKLFVRKVFITDELDILPRWLSWLLGLLDSDDLPLNVSRESLQQSKLIKLMRKKIVRKVLELLKKLSEDENQEKYNKFWDQFGTFLKLGAAENDPNTSKIVKLMRFASSANAKNLTSLDGYVSRMKEGQKAIYYMTGLTREEVETSPLIERLIAQGYEVLYAIDPMDEYVFQASPEFEGHKFQNVGKEGWHLGDEKKEKKLQKKLNDEYAELAKFLKEKLADKVESVTASIRLEGSPCALVAKSWGVTGTMQKIMRAQAQSGVSGNPMMGFYLSQKPGLEINPRHPLIQKLKELHDRERTEELDDKIMLMYEAAVLRSGYELQDTSSFAQRIERVLRTALHVDLERGVDAAPEVEDDDEEEEKKEDEKEAEDAASIEILDDDEADAKKEEEEEAEKPHDEL